METLSTVSEGEMSFELGLAFSTNFIGAKLRNSLPDELHSRTILRAWPNGKCLATKHHQTCLVTKHFTVCTACLLLFDRV